MKELTTPFPLIYIFVQIYRRTLYSKLEKKTMWSRTLGHISLLVPPPPVRARLQQQHIQRTITSHTFPIITSPLFSVSGNV